MNKRARMRLIGVTAIILLAVIGMVMVTGNKQGAYEGDLATVAGNKSLIGKQVKVGGTVVSGSWDKKSNPMRFTIRGEKDTTGTGPTLKVVYTGNVPATFGDGVVAIVTGTLTADGTVEAPDMITKCPSKYESATGATPIGDLTGKGASMDGKPVRVTGFVKAGTIKPVGTAGDRFVVTNTADGSGQAIPVTYTGALPDTIKDGTQVVMGGALESGKFVATSVALEAGQK